MFMSHFCQMSINISCPLILMEMGTNALRYSLTLRLFHKPILLLNELKEINKQNVLTTY